MTDSRRFRVAHEWGLHVAALLAGAALPLSFAPFEWRWLAFVSLVILFYVWRQGRIQFLVLRGFLFGIGMFGVGIYWVYYSLHLFGGAVAPLAIIFTVGFVAFLASFIALLGWLLARFFSQSDAVRSHPLWIIAVLPGMWTLCEIFRGWFLTGFPWLSLGYSQIDTPLSGYAPILGVYGLSWLVATGAGLGCLVLIGKPHERMIALSGIMVIGLGGSLLGRVEWSKPTGDPLRVRMVQGNIQQHQKFMANLLMPSIETHKRLSETSEKVDLIIWPESAVPTFFFRVDQTLRDFARQQRLQGTHVLSGGFIFDRENGAYYNSLRMLDDPDAYYHKRHLVPFGEFMPFRSVLKFLSRFVAIPMSDLSPGEGKGKDIRVKGQLLGLSICYEDAFGEEVIRQLPEATLLINVSNDSWFGDSTAPYQHLEIARMRALETARPMVRVTNTGVSAAIDYRGRIYAQIENSEQHAINVTVQPHAGLTWYVSYGNLPVLLITITLVLLGHCVIKRQCGNASRYRLED